MGPCLCGDPYCQNCGSPFRCPVCREITIEVDGCCDKCGAFFEPEMPDEPPDMSDVEADADTLRSAGMGTDEDYGYFGDDYGS